MKATTFFAGAALLGAVAVDAGVHKCAVVCVHFARPSLTRLSCRLKLNKLPAPSHDSALLHLSQQTLALQQKYLGRLGYGYPPGRSEEEGEFKIQSIDELGGKGHGVPLSNFLNAQY
jgi:hypothetical protein